MVVDGELKRFGSEVAFSSLEMQKSFVAGDIYREKLENSRCSLLCLVGTDVSPEAEKLLKWEIEKRDKPLGRKKDIETDFMRMRGLRAGAVVADIIKKEFKNCPENELYKYVRSLLKWFGWRRGKPSA